MIAEQVPISREAVAAAVASPWGEPADDVTPAQERVEGHRPRSSARRR